MNIPQNVKGTMQLSCCNSRAGAPHTASPKKISVDADLAPRRQVCIHADFSLGVGRSGYKRE